MKTILVAAALAAAGACLCACSTATTSQLLTNLSNDCERHYDGTVQAGLAGGGFSGTVKIDCAAKAPPAAVVPAP